MAGRGRGLYRMQSPKERERQRAHGSPLHAFWCLLIGLVVLVLIWCVLQATIGQMVPQPRCREVQECDGPRNQPTPAPVPYG